MTPVPFWALPLFCYAAFWVFRTIYRLYFHPLASYPGSKLAAVSTEWYEWYWNIYQPGRLLFEIENLHDQHGPVIRIGANEIHVNDPDFFQDITRVGSRFTKEPEFYRGISCPTSSIGLVDPIKHRIRRQVLAPTFSQAGVKDLSSSIEEKTRHLESRLAEAGLSESALVDLAGALRCYTLDVVSGLVFGRSFGALSSQQFKHPQLELLSKSLSQAWLFRAYPTLMKVSLTLPEWLSSTLCPVPIIELGKYCLSCTESYLRERAHPSASQDVAEDSDQFQKSPVLERLLEKDVVKGHIVPNVRELNEEALMLLTAGNDTTASAMIFGVYYIASHPVVLEKLQTELQSVDARPDEMLSYDTAKSLPYLTATIKEILRCSNPLPGRLPRIIPPGGYNLYGRYLPQGTVVHTSSYLLNRHPSIWGADGNDFNPSRWLGADGVKLDRRMASFYRGSRQCLGINLAWCEMYLVLSMIFRRFRVTFPNASETGICWTDHLLKLYDAKQFYAAIEVRRY